MVAKKGVPRRANKRVARARQGDGPVAIIPARFGSTRLPGKPLLAETGKPLIQHVYEQVIRTPGLAEVIVATDDERIVAAVEAFGGQAVLTSPEHTSGSDRVAEVASGLKAKLILNVQGDEPEVAPEDLAALLELMAGEKRAPMGTLAYPSEDLAQYRDPNVVKVILDAEGYALYFSRLPIPFYVYRDDRPGRSHFLKHLGIYAYRRDFLRTFSQLPRTPLEEAEKLEQLRALEHGYRIRVGIARCDSIGIDTPEGYRAFVTRFRERAAPTTRTGGD